MDTGQFSLNSADNKGILSLLSAIEQTGDNFETDPESPEPHEAAFNQLEGLDIGLSLNKSVCLCLVCGHSDEVNMVHIALELSGTKIADRIEDIVSRKIVPEKHSNL